jgi:hypothetical protein
MDVLLFLQPSRGDLLDLYFVAFNGRDAESVRDLKTVIVWFEAQRHTHLADRLTGAVSHIEGQ